MIVTPSETSYHCIRRGPEKEQSIPTTINEEPFMKSDLFRDHRNLTTDPGNRYIRETWFKLSLYTGFTIVWHRVK
jgi:hypothetical protein